MIAARSPDYQLRRDVTYVSSQNSYETKTLPQGTFVRPITLSYVPKHVVQDDRWKKFDKERDIFCYVSHGIIPIERSAILEL